MNIPNNFSEYYAGISDTALLSILEKPEDYQPEALEAARKEFEARNLSGEAIQDAMQLIVAKQAQQDKQQQSFKQAEAAIKNKVHVFLDTINPIQAGLHTTEKSIRYIVIVFAAMFLYQLCSDFNMHVAFIKDIPRFPVDSMLYLLPLILLPIAVFTFWKRKSYGWNLLAIFICFSSMVIVFQLIQILSWKPSGFSELDSIFLKPSPWKFLVQLLFLVSVLYTLCRPATRQVFSTSVTNMTVTIIVSSCLTLFLLLSLY